MDLHNLNGENAAPMPAARKREDRGDKGSTHSITEPLNASCSILNRGMDSLYLTYKGTFAESIDNMMQFDKSKAQSEDPRIRATAVRTIAGHDFEVADKVGGGWSFALNDGHYRMKFSRDKSPLPFAVVQVSSGHLQAAGIRNVTEELDFIMGQLSDNAEATTNRIDHFCDVVTNFDLSTFRSKDFITRCDKFNFHEEKSLGDRPCTGISIGLESDSPLGCRIYKKRHLLQKDKDRDLERHRTVWEKNGWNGVDEVIRFEFQANSEGLKSLGVKTVDDWFENERSLWAYFTQKFVRLIDDDGRKRKEQCLVHPLWLAIQQAYGGELAQPSSRTFPSTRFPNLEYTFKNGFEKAVSDVMAIHSCDRKKAIRLLPKLSEDYFKESTQGKMTAARHSQSKADDKRRRFNKPATNEPPDA